MSGDEFTEWLDDHCAAFPYVAPFLSSVDFDRTRNLWFEILRDCELAHAKIATRRLLRGAEPEIEAKDRHKTPRIVAAIAHRIRREMEGTPALDAEAALPPARFEPLGLAWECAAAGQELITAIEAGENKRDALERICPVDPEALPRYVCLICRDRGRVTCWHRYSMELAARGILGREKYGEGRYAASVVCSCTAGDMFTRDDRLAVARFDPLRWLPCDGLGPDEVEKLYEFMGRRFPVVGGGLRIPGEQMRLT